ncbi:MAG: SDR family oxidoreductase [Psychroflexus sp.]|nr:SDR family oxidoreductase [Psychroflexus sp.]
MSKNKVVIITGAGSGMGYATAKRFVKDGFKVVLNGRNENKLKKAAAEIGSENCLVVPGDVSIEKDIEHLINLTIQTYDRLDVLVNNAGIFIGGGIENLSLADWNKQFAVNSTGPFLTIKKALPYLEKTKGNIVNVSSVSGIGGDWGALGYDASKGALNLLTKALALDFAPKGIRINAIAPSLTDTDMGAGAINDKEMMAEFKKRIAMGRAGKSEEIADVIAFLASEESSFITGTILPVDGGLSASNGQPKL